MRREGKLTLELEASTDVLAELAKHKNKQVFFGFAAEAGEGEAEFAKAREKIQKKKLDLLALNNITRKDIGFDADQNEVYLFEGQTEMRKIPKDSKKNLAETLLLEAKRFQEARE